MRPHTNVYDGMRTYTNDTKDKEKEKEKEKAKEKDIRFTKHHAHRITVIGLPSAKEVMAL